jgi:hypothetical protein
MTLQRRQPFQRIHFIGFAFLAVANVSRWILERHSSMPENPRDALIGLFFGVGIGCLLLGVWRMNHGRPPSDRSRCA